MVKGYLLVRWGLISSEDTTNNVGPRSCPTNVRQFLEPKRFYDVIEVLRSVYIKPSKENGSSFQKQRVQEGFLGYNRIGEEGKSRGREGVGR
jgi:hypothetical protein